MSDTIKLDSAAAVRLARFTYPKWPTGDRLYWVTPQEDKAEWLAEDPQHRSVTSLPEAWGKLDPAGQVVTRFRAWSLDDLAKTERLLVDAEIQRGYFNLLWDELKMGMAYGDAAMVMFLCGIRLITAPSEARARALIQLLDQHPEFEKAQ